MLCCDVGDGADKVLLAEHSKNPVVVPFEDIWANNEQLPDEAFE
jgi:hypothetical protein